MTTQAQYLNARVDILDTHKLGSDLARESRDATIRFQEAWGLADTPAGPILLSRSGRGMARPIRHERPGWIEAFTDTVRTRAMIGTWLRLPEERLGAYRTGADETNLAQFLLANPTGIWEQAFQAAFEHSVEGVRGCRARGRQTGALIERQLDAIAGEVAAEMSASDVADLRDIVAEIDHNLARPRPGQNRWGILGSYIAIKIEQVCAGSARRSA